MGNGAAVQCSTADEACTAAGTHHFRRVSRVNTLMCHPGGGSRHIEAPRGHQTLQHSSVATHTGVRCKQVAVLLFMRTRLHVSAGFAAAISIFSEEMMIRKNLDTHIEEYVRQGSIQTAMVYAVDCCM